MSFPRRYLETKRRQPPNLSKEAISSSFIKPNYPILSILASDTFSNPTFKQVHETSGFNLPASFTHKSERSYEPNCQSLGQNALGLGRNFVSVCGTGFQPVKTHGQDGRATWTMTQKSLQSSLLPVFCLRDSLLFQVVMMVDIGINFAGCARCEAASVAAHAKISFCQVTCLTLLQWIITLNFKQIELVYHCVSNFPATT